MRNEEILRANLKALSEALRNQRNPPKPSSSMRTIAGATIATTDPEWDAIDGELEKV